MDNASVRNCGGLRFDFAYKLTSELPQFHGCRQETRDPWVRDKGHYYSQHSKQHEVHIYVCSLWPHVPGGECEVSWMDSAHAVGLCYSCQSPSLRNLQYWGCWQICPTFALEGGSIYVTLVRKQICFLPSRQTLFLFFKALCCTNTLGKAVLGRSCHKACRNAMENCSLPTMMYWTATAFRMSFKYTPLSTLWSLR